MRIAIVSHSPHLCGGERMMLNLAEGLERSGQARCLVLAGGEGPMYGLASALPFRIDRLDEPVPWYLEAGTTPRALTDFLAASNRSAREVAARVRDWGADLVVVNTLTNLAGLLAAARLNLPLVAWIHGILDSDQVTGGRPELKRAFDDLIVRSAARTVCPSDWTASFFRQEFGVEPAVVPNATRIPDAVSPPTGAIPTFCCLNTWESHKGLFTLLDAVSILKRQGRRFRLDLFGAGPLGEELRRRIVRASMEGTVRLRGRVTDVSAVYAESHALVTASSIEPFGMTLIEAMAHGRPIIVSDTSGHREIVPPDAEFGFRLPTEDVEAFADRMAWVIDNPEAAVLKGQAGREAARTRFGLDRLASDFAGLFKDVLRDEAARSADEIAHRYDGCRLALCFCESSFDASEPEFEEIEHLPDHLVLKVLRAAFRGAPRTKARLKRVARVMGVYTALFGSKAVVRAVLGRLRPAREAVPGAEVPANARTDPPQDRPVRGRHRASEVKDETSETNPRPATRRASPEPRAGRPGTDVPGRAKPR